MVKKPFSAPSHYIRHLSVADELAIFDVAPFYTDVERDSESGKIADEFGQRPSCNTRARQIQFRA
jgi:hypothetical protein